MVPVRRTRSSVAVTALLRCMRSWVRSRDTTRVQAGPRGLWPYRELAHADAALRSDMQRA